MKKNFSTKRKKMHLRMLSTFPPFDWYLNLNTNPWDVPHRHRKVALIEHTLYGLLGFMASFLPNLKLAIMVFVVAATIGTPIEVYLGMKSRWIWKFMKGRERREISFLFLSMLINVFIYYMIGACIANILFY